MKLKLLRLLMKKFHNETRIKFSTASSFQIIEDGEPETKTKRKNELFEFQHAGVAYCICGHDQNTCHPDEDVCLNRKCDCLQYIPSEFNNKLDTTDEQSALQYHNNGGLS